MRGFLKHVFLASLFIAGSSSLMHGQNDDPYDLPLLLINTNGAEILDDPKITAQLQVLNNTNGLNFPTDTSYEYNGQISIEIRGSTSQIHPKKSFSFETQGLDGSNNNVSLLGMPEENDWVLYAPYADKSLMRNVLAYHWSNALGHYAPRTVYCEVFLNGEYMGVYVLTEKIKRDAARVDVPKMNASDSAGDSLTGGYIVKIDKLTGATCQGFSTDSIGMYIQYEYPKCSDITTEQQAYISSYINAFEDALYAANFSDTASGYRRYLDVNTAIDYLIMNELSRNIDAYLLSTFLTKDRGSNGGKLSFGPVWDFNIAFGNEDVEGFPTHGLIADHTFWWSRLYEDTSFARGVQNRWNGLRENLFSDQRLSQTIDSLADFLHAAQGRNYYKWDVLDEYVWPNYYMGPTYEDEVRFLKSWLLNRVNWLDNNISLGIGTLANPLAYDATVFPNPFDYFITCSFELQERSNVSVYMIDPLTPTHTDVLVADKSYEAGNHKLVWNSLVNGAMVSSKMYLLVIEVNGRVVTKEKIIHKF